MIKILVSSFIVIQLSFGKRLLQQATNPVAPVVGPPAPVPPTIIIVDPVNPNPNPNQPLPVVPAPLPVEPAPAPLPVVPAPVTPVNPAPPAPPAPPVTPVGPAPANPAATPICEPAPGHPNNEICRTRRPAINTGVPELSCDLPPAACNNIILDVNNPVDLFKFEATEMGSAAYSIINFNFFPIPGVINPPQLDFEYLAFKTQNAGAYAQINFNNARGGPPLYLERFECVGVNACLGTQVNGGLNVEIGDVDCQEPEFCPGCTINGIDCYYYSNI